MIYLKKVRSAVIAIVALTLISSLTPSSSHALAQENGASYRAATVTNFYWEQDVGSQIELVTTADLVDTDGQQEEIIVSTVTGDLLLLRADSTQLWRWTSDARASSPLTVADLTGDRTPEILIGSSDSNIYVLNGNTGILIWQFTTQGSVTSLTTADVTGDGLLEVLAGSDDAKRREDVAVVPFGPRTS